MKKSLKAWQIAFFFIAFMPVTKIFVMPSIASRASNEDMWISILFNMLFDLLTIAVLLFSTRLTNLNYFSMLERSFGKVLTKIILVFYVLTFMLKSIAPFQEQKDYVLYTLYIANSDAMFYIAVFIIPFYLAIKNLNTIGRCANLMFVFTILSFMLILFLSVLNVDLSKLLPIGANGMPNILRGSYLTSNWFGDSAYFLFLLGEYKRKKKSSLIIILGYVISMALVLIFSIIFWCSFTSIASKQRFALTELFKYVTIINNISRFDFLAIFFILFVDIVAISLPIYFSTHILAHVFNTDKKWIFALVLTAIIFIVIMFLPRFFYSIELFVSSYGGIIFILFSNLLPILTAVICAFKEKKNEIQNA